MLRDLNRIMLSGLCTMLLVFVQCNRAAGADPQVSLSVYRLTFGAQAQGTSSTDQFVQVTNNGQGDLMISGISITGESSADFVQTNNCPISPATVATNGHCEIHVVFHPASDTGVAAATLSINDNASGSPHSVLLAGTPTPAVPVVRLVPASLSFGGQAANTLSPDGVIVLTNIGSTVLHINAAVSLTGSASSEFRVHVIKNGCPTDQGELAPGASCNLGVIFAPASIGAKSAQLTVVDDAPGSPHTVSLSGTGTAPQNTP
jgi:hypothetical protein